MTEKLIKEVIDIAAYKVIEITKDTGESYLECMSTALDYATKLLKINNKELLEVISMKSTGIVRRVDELGRVVLPVELRRTLNIDIKDSLEIYVDGDQIILKKYEPACIFCGEAKDIVRYKDKVICKSCAEHLGGK